ncbi:MAG: DHA2 family efflux MFS transporter permease subunit [Rhodospirillales bacterium]|nr:DHA2 family efflux MFS transporter permease subunit [Rhodospirillales bacterium]
MSGSDPHVPRRALITGCVMMATLMQVLDSAIANVALPYMQGSLSATQDEITWVLTSYVIAAAIMTAPVGWLAVRFGRKRLFIICLAGFTLFSMLCGAAETLAQIVLFRLAQGMCGAALVPLSQATMLDIYPFERRAHAMAIFSSGVMLGPIMGPTLGGYLTYMYNWRYVFYVNLPFGVLAMIGLALFLPSTEPKRELRFDWWGFSVLAMGVGCLQMVLDRGQLLDWFSSREIILYATLAGLGFYLFVVHMLTARRPFLDPALFRDRNFIASITMGFFVSMIMLATSALLAPYLEDLANFPVFDAGIALAPRGLGTMAAMFFASWLSHRVDSRKIMAAGLVVVGFALHAISRWTPDVTETETMLTMVVQGFGTGLVFNPMTVVAFVTLPARLRGDATALQALGRNMGQAIGISVTTFTLERSEQAMHADIAARITPFDRVMQGAGAVSRLLDPLTAHGAALLNDMIDRQAQIIAYNNDFHAMSFAVVPPLLLILLLRRIRPTREHAAREHAGREHPGRETRPRPAPAE